LDQVLETAEEFSEIRDITARHDTLVTTHMDLMETDHSNQDAVEVERGHLLKLIEEKNNEILNFNNKVCLYKQIAVNIYEVDVMKQCPFKIYHSAQLITKQNNDVLAS
jgi:hypothetical protein